MKKTLLILLTLILVCSCGKKDYFAGEEAWFQTGQTINPDYTDVIYFVSTNIMESSDAEGNRSFRAVLTPDEKAVLSKEIDYIHKNIFPDSLNYFSPFYHQVTFEGFYAPAEEYRPALAATEQECLDAFNYYMKHLNGGRPYILAGFSQGAMIVKSLLKSMTDKQFEQMVAAYVIGFEITAEDLKSPHIVPAQNATDKGVTISFNSVCSVEDVWPLIYSDPVTCINPVNWCTDATPAPLMDGETSLSVAVDPEYQVVVVTGYGDNPPKAGFEEPWPEGNLHHEEILIYAPSLARNALDRAY